MRSILINVTIVQCIFVKLSIANKVITLNFLQCGLSAKKPDVKINGQRLFRVKKAHWLFAVSMLTGPVPLI